MIAAAMLLLGGCSAARPTVLSGPDPADPQIVPIQATPVSVNAGNGVLFPVAPLPWDVVNRRVTPGSAVTP